jgi:multisubunit Na+/H+ antiporter MnhB subunit
MSHEVRRRGRNWFTAMGVLFIVMALIALTRNLLIWGPEFVLDFFLSSDITNEKISVGMIVFGGIMIVLGFRKKIDSE